MGEWKKVKIQDIAAVVGGGTPKTSVNNYWNGNIPWLTPRDLTGYAETYIKRGQRNISSEGLKNSSAKLMPEGAVLLTSRAPIGYIAIASNEICTNQGFKSLILEDKVAYNIFVYYWLKGNNDYLQSLGTGTTFAEISGSVVKQIELDLPPIAEQKAIASVLTSLDNKIDLLNRQNRTLESLAETLFRQWFIEDAQDDWEDGVIPNEFDFVMGASPPGDSYNETGDGIPMFQGNADFTFRFPVRRIYTNEPKRFAEKYDTLISVRAPVGDQNMARERCCIGRGVAAFRYRDDSSYYTYTYYKLRSLMKEIKVFNDEGTVFGSISKTDFQSLVTVIPSKRLIEDFQEKVKPLDDKIILNCNQIIILEKLRNTLLPKLMSGEVRVQI